MIKWGERSGLFMVDQPDGCNGTNSPKGDGPNGFDVSTLPEGDLLVSADQYISQAVAARIKEEWNRVLPGRRVVVVSEGLRVEEIGVTERLKRIEQKLDDISKGLLR